MASRTPGQSPSHQLLSDWQAKNPTAQDFHDKLHKINRRREMQILEAWFTSESEDSNYFCSSKKYNSNDDRTPSQIQAALDNFDSNSFKPPVKGLNRKTSPSKVEEVNLNRCDTFKEKREMGSKHLDGGLISTKHLDGGLISTKHLDGGLISTKPSVSTIEKREMGSKHLDGGLISTKHLDGGLISTKPSMKKQLSKETEIEDSTLMHEIGMSGSAKSLDNMAGSSKAMTNDKASSLCNTTKNSGIDCSAALNGIHSFTYKEIAQATDGFSDKFLIGKGAFGKVFSAVLKNTKCAVKKLFSREEVSRGDISNTSEEHIKRELATLSRYRHNNIVLLYGYMIDQPDVCLVYQLMANGSLEDMIARKNNTPSLTWKQRLGILRGAACGLQFLHTLTDTPLIHGDIKSGNILLDSNFEAKISDLGMAQHATSGSETGLLTHITKKQADTKQYQTRAYLPPEAQRGSKMSVKGDTYSFGVVIFEICTGEKSFDEKREGADAKFLVEYMHEMVGDDEEKFYSMCHTQDKSIPQDLFNSVFKMALTCTCQRKKGRPEMKMVFTDLEKLEEDFDGRLSNSNGVCETVNKMDQSTMQCYMDSQGGYITYYPGSIDPQLEYMISQFPQGTQLPEPLVLQIGYDQTEQKVDVDMEFKAKQKLAEIEKYQEEFNKIKEMVVDDKTQDENQNDEEGSTNEDIDKSKEQNGEVESDEVLSEHENESLLTCDDNHVDCEDEVNVENEQLDQAERQLKCMKLQPADPNLKQKFAKSRDDFFARFQQQILLESNFSDDSVNVCENDDEDEDENTLVEEENQNYDYEPDLYEDCSDSNQIFGQIDENEDQSCENNDVNENYDYGETLDAHRQKIDNYQIIAREMSDESGKVVGELVESDQRPFEGDISESENSLSNDFGRNSSLETDSDEIVLNYQNDNINVLKDPLSQKNNFPWPLQRRPEATESECYV